MLGVVESGPIMAEILAGSPEFQLPSERPLASLEGSALHVRFSEFGVGMGFPVVRLDADPRSGLLDVRARVDGGTNIVLHFEGEFERESSLFRCGVTFLDLERFDTTPRAEFIALSTWALFGLSDATALEITELDYTQRISLKLPPEQISSFLRRRTFARKVLAISLATGTEFAIPEDLSARDIADAEFMYDAITRQSFEWPMDQLAPAIPASPADILAIMQAGGTAAMHLRVEDTVFTLLGKDLSLGDFTIHIPNARLRGAHVDTGITSGAPRSEITVRAADGIARYEFHGAPAAVEPDDDLVRALDAASDELSKRLATKYEELASATLAGLTAEEIHAVTTRPRSDAVGIEPAARKRRR